MMVSTKGRYALRVMLDLAEHATDGQYLSLKTIAERQGISLKYLEQIIPLLKKGGLVEGVQGKGGGYRLMREPALINVLDVIELMEGDIAPVSCLEKDYPGCGKSIDCPTYPMWKGLETVIKDYFSGITIGSLIEERQ